MKERISKLIDLKSIATLIITLVFSYGFIVGKIEPQDFMTITIMIFTFYFAKKNNDSEVDK